MKTRLTHFIWVLLFLFSSAAFAQKITVTGKVTDKSDTPLPGVNVIVKGTVNGIATDFEGKFSLKVPKGAILVFSYVGFKNKEVYTSNKPSDLGTIKLEEEDSLEEVVVTAYAIKAQRAKTGSAVTSVSAEVIKAPNLPTQLAGHAAGVQITTFSSKKSKKEAKTWKRSNGDVNRVRLEIGNKETLSLHSRQIAVKVEGFRARVLMDCYFYNDKKRQFEGTFKLRLPNGASPYFFAFGETKHELKAKTKVTKQKVTPIDYQQTKNWQFHPDSVFAHRKQEWSKVKQARVVPKQKAANAYTQTVAGNIDPALMEWSGADVFSCRVFPLVAKKMHHIVIGYDLNLLEVQDQYFLQLALGNTKEKAPLKVEMLLEGVSANDLKITPKVSAKASGTTTRLSWQNPQSEEVRIVMPVKNPVLLKSSGDAKINYFATSFKTNLPKVPKTDLKENVVFLLDVSLSSQPDKFNVWLKTMIALLQNNQDVIKNFSVLCFNIDAFWWKKTQVRNSNRNIRRFLRFANRLSLQGATDLGVALDAVNQAEWLKNQSKYLFLLSDGDVTWGENNLYQLSKKVAKTDELYAFSAGFSGTDPRILDYLTRNTNGAVFSIVNEDEIQDVSQKFRYAPWRIDQVTMNGAYDFVLAGRPQYLYAGQKIILAGRYQQLETPMVAIQVFQKNRRETLQLTFKTQIASELAKRVYGQISTTQLEDLGYLAEKEAIQYAVHYRVPGQTCSFVMLESERDYQRYNIKKEDNVTFIQKNPLNELLQKLLSDNQKLLGNTKAEFLYFLKKLKTAQSSGDSKFELPAALKNLIDKIPADYFLVNVPRLKTTIPAKRRLSKPLIATLLGGGPDYQVITEGAELASRRNKDDAIRLLSSMIEKNSGDLNLLRDVGFWVMKWGKTAHSYFLMKKLIDLRPFQPSSYQLIAHALQDMGNNELAMLYYEVALNIQWDDDYEGIGNVVGVEYLRLLNKMLKQKSEVISADFLKQRIAKLKTALGDEDFLVEKADLLITVNWNTNETDVDLHVKEANGKICYYKNNRTKGGGYLSEDMTEGFGPEMYFVRKASKGDYQIKVDFYAENRSRFKEKTKVYLCIYKNWGKANEQVTRQVITLGSEDIKKKKKDKMQLIANLKF